MRKTIRNPLAGAKQDVAKQSETLEHGLAYSDAVAVEMADHKRAFISGVVPWNEQEEVIGRGDVEKQTRTVLEAIEGIMEDFGGSMQDIVRVRVYVNDLNEEDFQQVHEVRNEFFERDHFPSSTLIEVSELAFEGMMIEIDADAIIPDDGWETDSIE